MTTDKYSKIPYMPSSLADGLKTPTFENIKLSKATKNIMITSDHIPYSLIKPDTPIGISFDDVYGISQKSSEDTKLSNIHEPLSNLEKRVYELELNDERKDIIIHELREKLETKRRKSKTTKRKSKTSQFVKIRKELDQVKKKLSTYDHEWRFTKDMHAEEAKDTSEE